jgi:hypothetical protein
MPWHACSVSTTQRLTIGVTVLANAPVILTDILDQPAAVLLDAPLGAGTFAAAHLPTAHLVS